MFKILYTQPHMLIDLETLSLKQNARVISIGAVYHNLSKPAAAEYFCENISFTDHAQRERDIDPDTVNWWMEQSMKNPDSLKMLRDPEPVSTALALLNFSSWYFKVTKDDEAPWIWGNGVDFDNSILLSLYQDMLLDAPFSYRKNMDYRTIHNLIKINNLEHLKAVPTIAHNALEDAKAEFSTLTNFLKHACGC